MENPEEIHSESIIGIEGSHMISKTAYDIHMIQHNNYLII